LALFTLKNKRNRLTATKKSKIAKKVFIDRGCYLWGTLNKQLNGDKPYFIVVKSLWIKYYSFIPLTLMSSNNKLMSNKAKSIPKNIAMVVLFVGEAKIV